MDKLYVTGLAELNVNMVELALNLGAKVDQNVFINRWRYSPARSLAQPGSLAIVRDSQPAYGGAVDDAARKANRKHIFGLLRSHGAQITHSHFILATHAGHYDIAGDVWETLITSGVKCEIAVEDRLELGMALQSEADGHRLPEMFNTIDPLVTIASRAPSSGKTRLLQRLLSCPEVEATLDAMIAAASSSDTLRLICSTSMVLRSLVII